MLEYPAPEEFEDEDVYFDEDEEVKPVRRSRHDEDWWEEDEEDVNDED
jgi:hypothetical protein